MIFEKNKNALDVCPGCLLSLFLEQEVVTSCPIILQAGDIKITLFLWPAILIQPYTTNWSEI